MTILPDEIQLSNMSDNEIKAEDLVKRGEIDEAITIYQSMEPVSAHVLNIIGVLYAEQKGDYNSAINYYERALQIQEENGEDTSTILTELGFTYQNLRDFDLALVYQFRALSVRELNHDTDIRLIARNLFGIANAHWGQENLSEALIYAQQALTLNESIESGNDSSIATNLAILSNIYHKCGDDIQALELAKRALILLEGCESSNSLTFAAILNNIGTIQFSLGLFNDALLTFIRVLQICEKTLPEEHPKRVAIANNIQRITEMQEYNGVDSFAHLWTFLSKISLL